MSDSHQYARQYYKCWLESGKPSTGDVYNAMKESRRQFKNKLKWCYNNQESIKMNILATHCKSKHFSKFWNATKKFNFKRKLPASVDGLQDPKNIADMFADRFKIKVSSSSTCDVNYSASRLSTENEDSIAFTGEDVTKAIRGMKRGKSPGYDGLGIEHLVHAGGEVHYKLATLYNLCLSYSYLPKPLMKTIVVPIAKNKTGDFGSPTNYRPISLGSVVGKVFEKLLHPLLLKNVNIDDTQFGFRPGMSTDMAIVSLKSTIRYYTRRDTSVYACFLDLSRAFDLVDYDLLWKKLEDSQVHSKIVGLLRYWYANQINNVKWGDTLSNDYRLDVGVRQGGLTSPDLFNIYMNDLIQKLRGTRIGCHLGGICVNTLSYADDMVLLSPSINGLRKLLSVCEHYANCHGLKYNVKKTQVLIFRAGSGPERIPEVKVDGSVVGVVRSFKYLGHILNEKLNDDEDIERERRALAVRSNMIARRFLKCSKEVKVTLFRAFCLPMYTCQLWSCYSNKVLGTIRVQYNDAFRILMKLPRYCSASEMFCEARVPDFFAVLRTRVASFWARLRNSGNCILRAVSDNLNDPMFSKWMAMHLNENKK